MKRRILALSRDRGSMQAIAPVIAALDASGSIEVITYATRESWPVTLELSLRAARLDEPAFEANPRMYLRSLFDTHRPDLILSGSSPARRPAPETPEQFAIQVAKTMGIRTLGILDTWQQCKERFCASSQANVAAPELIPDILCVLDRSCHSQLVALGIPQERMVITHNPWLDHVVRDAISPPSTSIDLKHGGLNIVFVSQPLAEMAHIRGWPFTQQMVFEELIESLPAAPTGAQHRIWIWVHPTEAPGRWGRGLIQPRHDVEAYVSHERGAGILAHVDLVVTSHSTVVYEALHYGTPCVSLRPGGKALPSLVTDDLGLTRVFHSSRELKAFLVDVQIKELRAELRQRRDALIHANIFFNDGHATDRVLHIVDIIH